MSRTWDQISESEDYQKLSQNNKNALKERYFNEVVSTRKDFTDLDEDNQAKVRANFLTKPSLYSAANAEMDEELSKDHPYLTAVHETVKEGIATPALHFANQAALNLPRAATQAAGYSYPEAKTVPGNILAKGAGLAGAMVGGPAKLYKAVGQGLVKNVPKLAGKGLSKALVKGAIKGGITGAAYTPTESGMPILAPKERAEQAVTGAVAGGLIEGAGAGFRSFKAARLKKNKLPLNERLNQSNTQRRLDYQEQKINLEQDNIQAAKVQAENNRLLSEELNNSIDNAVPVYKETLKGFSKSLSQTYDDRLTAVSEIIGDDITQADVGRFLNSTAENLRANPDYAQTNAIKDIVNLAKKYNPKSPNAKKPVDFRQVNASVKKILSKRNFDTDTNVDALVRDELRGSFGDFVAGYSDEFAKLQTEMAPALQMKKLANGLFSRGKSKTNATTARNLFKKYALGKASREEVNMVDDMQRILGEQSDDILATTKALKDAGGRVTKNVSEAQLMKQAHKDAVFSIKQQEFATQKNYTARQKKISELENVKNRKVSERLKKGLAPERLLDYAVKYAFIRALCSTARAFRDDNGGGSEPS